LCFGESLIRNKSCSETRLLTRTVGEDGEEERERRNPISADGPQSDEDAIAGGMQRTRQRSAVPLPPVVPHRRAFVDLHVGRVAQDRSRHFVSHPPQVDLTTRPHARHAPSVCRYELQDAPK